MPAEEPAPEEEDERAPWHFKLLLLAFAVYLLYRLVQLAIWGAGRLF